MAISGDAGDDTIDNLAALESTAAARAEAFSTTVTATLAVGSGDSVATGNAGATATSIANGIDGGEGADTIGNAATIFAGSAGVAEMARAEAGSTTVTVGVTVGAADNEASASAAAVAEASAAGIDGGAGNDTIDNTGTIRAGLDVESVDTIGPLALALAGSQTVDVGVSVGDAFSNASSDSSATAVSDIAAIRGGAGEDDIDNSGLLETFSSAEAVSQSTTTKVSLSLGAAEGGASSDASTTSTALGAGIDGGDDADFIDTSGEVNVESRAIARTSTNSLNLELVSIGASSQSADANSSATAEAIARAVYGGRGADTITASGVFEVTADSDVDSTARSSTLGILSLGDKDMRAASSANTTGYSLAVGIDGGEGDDVIDSAALVDVVSVANANSTSMSRVNSGANIAGSTNADVVSDARAVAIAEGIGIQGGIDALGTEDSDADTITSRNALTVTAEATGTSTSTADADAITVFGSAGAESVADASATVIARGTGIASGADVDSITTLVDTSAGTAGDIDVTVTASANVISTATASAGAGIGDASTTSRSDASVDMLAEALGIDSGSGDDAVSIGSRIGVGAISSGNVTSKSVTRAKTVFGDAKSGAVSNGSATRRSRAVGIDGGEGDDNIETTFDGVFAVQATSSGSVTTESRADAEASLFGDASSNTVTAAASEGLAEALGIAGGSGADTIRNAGTFSADAESELTITSTSVSIADATFGDAFAGASSDTSIAGRAVAAGITGDDGNDIIITDGTLSIDGSALTDVKQVTVALADSTFGSANTVAGSRNASRAEVRAAGIDGGNGDDTVTADGRFAVAGTANVSVDMLTVSSSGPASSDAETLAVAEVSAIDSGDGDDSITANGAILVAAAPHVGVAKRTYGKGGNVQGNVGIGLRADASGISAGAGDDQITVGEDGGLLVVVGRQDDSTLTTAVESGANRVVDASLIGAEPEAVEGKWLRIDPKGEAAFFTQVLTFDPGTGEMTLGEPVPFDLEASVAYTLFDVDSGEPDIEASTLDAGGRVSVTAATTGDVNASGLTGGAGDDTISNAGDVSVQASNATLAGSVTVAGNVQADLSTRSRVRAVGIDGDGLGATDESGLDGADTLGNAGTLSVDAASTIDFGSAEFSYFGQTNIDVGGEASALAIGIDGGGASDTVSSSGDISVVALGSVLARDRVTSVFSDIRQQLAFEASGSATGVSAGDGDDTLTIAGSADVTGTAQATVVGATNSQQFFSIFFGIYRVRTENLVDVTLDGTAHGFELGQGSDSVDNAASLTVRARSVPIGADVARAQSDPNLRETGARATALNTAVATGISGEAGSHDVSNSGTIDVTAESRATSFARAAEVLEADDQSSITATLPNDRFRDASIAGTSLDFTGKTVRLTTSDDGFTRRAASVTAVDGDLGANQFADETAADLTAADVVGTRIRFESDDPDVAAFESVVTAFEIVNIGNVNTPVFTLADALPVDTSDNPLLAVDDPYRLSVLTATVTEFDAATGTFTLDEALPAGAVGEGYTLSIVSSGQAAGQSTFVDASRIGEAAGSLENTWITFAGEDGFVSFVEDFDPLTGTFTLRHEIPFALQADDIYELAGGRGRGGDPVHGRGQLRARQFARRRRCRSDWHSHFGG